MALLCAQEDYDAPINRRRVLQLLPANTLDDGDDDSVISEPAVSLADSLEKDAFFDPEREDERSVQSHHQLPAFMYSSYETSEPFDINVAKSVRSDESLDGRSSGALSKPASSQHLDEHVAAASAPAMNDTLRYGSVRHPGELPVRHFPVRHRTSDATHVGCMLPRRI